ncbi:MAG TPA: phosphodiester glycosidase family protein [Blastocatellia bacterium]|nr:phosphodiester glycosidase family protein [Blastocatellia bacterium]
MKRRGLPGSGRPVRLGFLILVVVIAVLGILAWQIESRLRKPAQSADDVLASPLPPDGAARRIEYGGNRFDAYVVDVSKTSVNCFFKDDNGNRIGSLRNLDTYLRSKSRELIFATNADMYLPDGNPVGLLILDGKQHSSLNLKSGSGNFYLKPNGVFAIFDNRAIVTESSKFVARAGTTSPKIAVQSGPLLLIDGEIHPAFQQNSGNKYVRSGVGVISPTKIVFAISEAPVTFYEFAMLFKDRFHCNDALYLDGGVSRMFLPALSRYDADGDFAGIIAVTKSGS